MKNIIVILFAYLSVSLLKVYCDEKTTLVTLQPVDPVVECIRESKAAPGLVKKLQAGNWKIKDVQLQKWTLCYLVKKGVMTQNGVLRQDVVLENIPHKDKSRVEKTIDACLYTKRHNPIETAWHYLTCFILREPNYVKIANKF